MTLYLIKRLTCSMVILLCSLSGIYAANESPAEPGQQSGQLLIKQLRCEYFVNPLGIDIAQPRLSWELIAAERGTMQSAYQIRVALTESDLDKNNLVWDSERTTSEASIQIPYLGPALTSGQRYFWQVQAWDNQGHSSGWSQPAYWEMGLLQPADWQARWITPDLTEDYSKSNPSPMLRRVFPLRQNIAKARLYATAMGLYELQLNGRRVGDQYFTPGWTAYDFRYQYQAYDVTSLLKAGDNCLGAILGDGWFRGNSWLSGKYGKQLALLAQVIVTYNDGRSEIIGTDEDWKAATGPILASAM